MSQISTPGVNHVNFFREKAAEAKGEYTEDDGRIPTHLKKRKMMERISEWEKFEENCRLLREFDDETILKISELHKERKASAVHDLKEGFDAELKKKSNGDRKDEM